MGVRLPHSSTQIAIAVLGVLRALSICVLAALSPAPTAIAQIPEAAALTADIPAQPLAEALAAFASQTGLHVGYVFEVVRDKISTAVPAGLSAEEALARLLQGTGLKFEFLTPHSVRIVVATPGLAAQSPLVPDEPQVPLREVIITGSRIPVPANITAAGPLVVVSGDDIRLAGYTDTVDVISALPQMTTSVGADLSPGTGGFGTATANLRGLGPQRTVVLINGRRLGVGDPNTGNSSPAPDLDQIPLAMVERVEVLTGGSTVTYGSDAIAGVVNFILKDHVQGVQIDGQYGIAQHTQQNTYLQSIESTAGVKPPVGTILDGSRRDLSVLAGTELDGGDGQVTGYFIYHDQNPVYGSERDFTDCAAATSSSSSGMPQAGYHCIGGAGNLFGPGAGFGDRYSVVGNQFVPVPPPISGAVPPTIFNFAPYVNMQRQDTRYQVGVLAQFNVNQAAKPYFEFSFMNDHTLTQLAPSGLFAGADSLTPDGNYLVNCSNPLLSAQEAAISCTPAQIAADKAHPGSVSADVLIGRRNIEGGGRQFSFEHKNYRAVAGTDGQLGAAWRYNAYALYYYTSLFHASENNLNLAAINDALQVTTSQSGHPVCISGGSCVPYNIFTTSAVTPQQLAYLYVPGTDGGFNSERILEADVTGLLGRYGLITPWSREGVAINAGAEHRTETVRFAPDAAELSGDLSGFGGAAVAIDNSVSVNEGFVEMRAPIAQEQPLARDLTIGAGYRYSHYSTAGVTNTYKFDLQFAPIAGVRLRATYDRVVRAPNPIELYTPLSYSSSLTVGTDPCAPTNGGAQHAIASLAQCMRMGVTAAQYGNGLGPAVGGTSTLVQCVDAVCGAVNGGNPQLAPETADTWSVGLTFTPTTVPSLTGSLDYFHILLKGEIATIPSAITLQQCLATGEPAWCSQIVRTRAGDLSGSNVAGGGYIVERDVNTGAALVSGMDIQMRYLQPLAGKWGALGASLNGGWLQHNTSTPYRSAPSYDCAGLFGGTCLGGSSNPRWRHNLRLTWETLWNAQFSVQWRYIGRTDFDNNSSQTLLRNQEEGFFDPLLTHLPSYSYFDLSAIWNVTRHVQVRAGVNNVFDKDPPFVPAETTPFSITTLPPYDILGRYIYVGLGATF
jgi:outer membrane receptor protein involved in Fe transport